MTWKIISFGLFAWLIGVLVALALMPRHRVDPITLFNYSNTVWRAAHSDGYTKGELAMAEWLARTNVHYGPLIVNSDATISNCVFIVIQQPMSAVDLSNSTNVIVSHSFFSGTFNDAFMRNP